MFGLVSGTLAAILMTTVPARAAEKTSDAPRPALTEAVARAAKEAVPAMPAWAIDRPDRRPSVLPALYGTYAALQALDVYSTRRALASGAAEANPLLKSGTSAKTMAIKAAAGAGTIFFAERAWKKNRVGAIVMMAALNGVSAAVVAHNTHNAARR